MDTQPATASRAEGQFNHSLAQLAVFLDFDGTLVEIAERPELVKVPEDLPMTLIDLEQRLGGALAIITGRPLDAVEAFLAPARMAVAAAHGAEGRLSSGAYFGPPPEVVASARQIADHLAPMAEGEPRLVLERKTGAVALHFRQAPDLEAECRAAMHAAVATSSGFSVVEGKSVLEARPAGTDKGTAVHSFMQEPIFRNRVPIFVGDDRTDEDGFAAVQSLGGIGIKVGAGDTCAAYRAADVKDVQRLLGRLVSDGLTDALRTDHLTPVESGRMG